MRGGWDWTAANEWGSDIDSGRQILRECSVPVRLLAHRFVLLQFMSSAKFAYDRWKVDIEYSYCFPSDVGGCSNC